MRKIWKDFSDEELRKILDSNCTFRDAAVALGYKVNPKNSKVIKEIAEYLNYDLSQYNYRQSKYKVGDKYGFLTIKGKDEQLSKEKGKTYIIAQCDCGNIKTYSLDSLKSGNTTSCGCLRTPDLTGKRFGKLTVIEKITDRRCTYWRCKCDCGAITEVRATHLIKNLTHSCGCINSFGEQKIADFLIKNKIPFIKEYSFSNLKGEKNPLRFDFALFIKGKIALVEYQGIQHYEAIGFFGGEERLKQQQEYDNKKIEYCHSNNLPLLILNKKEEIENRLREFIMDSFMCELQVEDFYNEDFYEAQLEYELSANEEDICG